MNVKSIDRNTIELRHVSAEDRETLEVVEDLELAAFGRAGLNLWALAPFAQHGRLYVAMSAGEVVAYTLLIAHWPGEPRAVAYMFSFAVKAEYQRQGVATRFLELLLPALAGSGIGRVELTVSPRNARAMHLYREKFGFELVRSLTAWYGEGEDRHYLGRDLDPPGA